MDKKDLDHIHGLMKKVVAGDSDAFSEFYDIYVNKIYRYVYFRVRNEDLDDVVELVFIKVWKNLDKYDFEQKTVTSWVFKIAQNVVIDYYRSNKFKEFSDLDVDLESDDESPVDFTQKSLDKEHFREIIDRLIPQYRDVLVYKYMNELSNSEIAEILEKSEANVRILVHRALKAFKKVFLRDAEKN